MSIALGLAIAGVVALVGAGVVLASVGPGLRIGRLLGGARAVPIDRAAEIAASGIPSYVKVSGRVSSDEEFPDDQNRPLVFRRTRLEIQSARNAWRTVFDEREAVRFGVEARSNFIAVDDVALGEGLVVIPRVSVGVARDLPDDLGGELPSGTDPGAAARLRIEQLSAVEHATVVGQPVLREGQPVMSSGLGRPLIVTTLEQSAAMRVLASGKRGRVTVGALAIGLGLGLLAGALAAFIVGA